MSDAEPLLEEVFSNDEQSNPDDPVPLDTTIAVSYEATFPVPVRGIMMEDHDPDFAPTLISTEARKRPWREVSPELTVHTSAGQTRELSPELEEHTVLDPAPAEEEPLSPELEEHTGLDHAAAEEEFLSPEKEKNPNTDISITPPPETPPFVYVPRPRLPDVTLTTPVTSPPRPPVKMRLRKNAVSSWSSVNVSTYISISFISKL